MVCDGTVIIEKGFQMASIFGTWVLGPFNFDGIQAPRFFDDEIDFCSPGCSIIREGALFFIRETFVEFDAHPLLEKWAGIGGERVARERQAGGGIANTEIKEKEARAGQDGFRELPENAGTVKPRNISSRS